MRRRLELLSTASSNALDMLDTFTPKQPNKVRQALNAEPTEGKYDHPGRCEHMNSYAASEHLELGRSK